MYCHDCDKSFSVDIDIQADGNHIFKCPHCQHEHCRVVKGSDITKDRWDTRNGNRGAVYYPRTYFDAPSTSSTADLIVADRWASTGSYSISWY